MPAIPITLFEHQPRSYAEIGLFPADPIRRDRVLAQLERINERAGQEIIHLGRKGLHANALVGVVGAGDFVFEILPKIDWDPEKSSSHSNIKPSLLNSEGTASSNLMAMLSYAYDLPIYQQEITGLGVQPASWLELLTRLFAAGLHREITSGIAQQYVSRDETLSVLRGRWDIQRQLKQPGREHTAFDVTYDDLSADFPLNQVFRFVIDRLQPTTRDKHTQALLADLAGWFRPVALLSQITPELLEGVQFNRLNERFQPSFQLARMFLSGTTIQLTAGNLPACAFVFDMNILFERFVAGFLTRYRREILPAPWQDATILTQSERAAWYLGRSSGKNLLRLRPDLVIMQQGQSVPHLVADTKYKRLDPAYRSTGASPDDIYQMLAYATRLKCPNGLLLYPQSTAHPIRNQIEIQTAGLQISIATANLRQPLSQPAALIGEMREIFAL